MNEDEFDEIERRVREMRNSVSERARVVQLHERLARYKQDPAYQNRYRNAMSMLTKVGFKGARRRTTSDSEKLLRRWGPLRVRR